jgi:hypothetical protein
MPDRISENLPHLLIKGTAETELYRSPKSFGGEFKLPPRQRSKHGNKLLSQLESLRREAEILGQEQVAFGVDVGNGIYIQFESEPGFKLKFESLDLIRSGIELVNVKDIGDKTYAVCFVPEGKLTHFVKLVTAYLEQETKSKKPRNQKLIESISKIRRAMLEALWTDDPGEMPTGEEEVWWEVWLRTGDDRNAFQRSFEEHAARIGLVIDSSNILFPDRTVCLAYGSKSQMSTSVNLLNSIAELRKAKETADFFTSLTPSEQFDWVDEALKRIEGPYSDDFAVCILDTGINNEHPLIRPALQLSDMHTYEPSWGITDHDNHGTEMAGLSIYGDLIETLASGSPIFLKHKLESVKILPPRGDNPPYLYGAITTEAIARAEITAPVRQRTICMAVTTKDFRDRGKPSSWSACLDKLTSGADDDRARLIVVSAGNTDLRQRHRYPESNQADAIHDPGQGWNALTVGAYTEKIFMDPQEYPGWIPVAPQGDLSPCSCTSMAWQRPWPIKPDIVLEGGNMATDPTNGEADFVDSLCLLTTNRQFTQKPLVVTGETSAATALASRMATVLWAEYPDYWPESIRGLLVHSADWTEAMKGRFRSLTSRSGKEILLRYCGFGVPNLNRAMWSAQNALTLIAQDSLQPFDKFENSFKTRDLNLHRIPWPIQELEELGETEVEMRVTLSYFIEPNPARRGWTRRYSYASHGLRFEVKTPTETPNQFRRRINQLARDEELGNPSSSDAAKWFLGPDLRALGSIHADRWTGTAVELAQRGLVAVYPVIGWWRERHQLGRWAKRARYSLIISIKTPETDLDIYTPVENLIRAKVEIGV